MTVASETLLQDLISRTQLVSSQAREFALLPDEKLNWRCEENSWSVMECVEHLNLYGDFYIPELTERIDHSNTRPTEYFTSGILGNYFAKSMLPKKKLHKMKTFKDKNPLGSTLDKGTVERFIQQQDQLLVLLGKAGNIDLNKTKTAISISKLITLKIGDTLRVVIYHNERHLAQANKVLERQGFM